MTCGFGGIAAGSASGQKLPARAEAEIRGRGHDTFRLRVVKSNIVAVRFYQSQGWKVHSEFPHEKFGHPMYEMRKRAEKKLDHATSA